MNRKQRISNVGSGDILTYYLDNSFSNSLSSIDIKAELEKPVISPRFRISLLNSDETIKNVIPWEDIIEGGTYTETYQNGQRRSLSLTLYNQLGIYTPSINGLWANSKFLFEMGLLLENGDILWFPKGVYQVDSLSPVHDTSNKTVQLQLSDKFVGLTGALGTLENTYTIPAGTLIEDVIRDILWYSRGDGEMIDPQSFFYHSSFAGKRTQATISKEAGDTFGDIIEDLCTMLSAEFFYDVEGHLTIVPISLVTDDADKPLIYDFFEDKGDFGSNNLNFDMSQIFNRVIVIGNNVNGETCRGVAVNDDPASPLCYQRIGYRTASPINDSNIVSSILAQERADYELRNQLIAKSSTTVTAFFNPLLTVNNLVSVTDNFYGFTQEEFLIKEISCDIDNAGKLNLTVSNIRNLPFVIGG